MKRQKKPIRLAKHKSQAGLSLIETLVATAILLLVAVGIMVMALTAITTTENQGHLAARTAEYAQDKMEQLLALAYGNSTSNTGVFPATSTGGTGLSIGGSADPANPVQGYVDYLDVNGNLTTAANWYYIRVWQIEAPAGMTNVKRITVVSRVSSQVGAGGALPQSTVVALRSDLCEVQPCP